jgi:hypothetical protein
MFRPLAAWLALLALPASAQTARFLTFENDLYFDTDRYYTNGIQYTERKAQPARPAWLAGACARLGCDGDELLSVQRDIGQLMYTPTDITVAAPQPLDHPWAGLLYAGRAWTLAAPDGLALTTLSWQAGVTGAPALAEPAQKLVHSILGRDPPRGWNNQVGTAPVGLVSVERRHAVPAARLDWGDGQQLRTTAYWRVAVGNLMTYAAGGMILTMGKDLPEVSPAPVGIRNRATGADTRCWVAWLRCTAFAGVEVRAMVYNVFLEGRLWGDDAHVRPRRLVGDLFTGVRLDLPHTRSAGHGPWFVQFRATRRSREFRSAGPVKAQSVGALTVGVDW